MFFKKKNVLKTKYDNELLENILSVKEQLSKHTQLLDRCIEPTDELIAKKYQLENTYYFYLKEAKVRKIRIM
ncbi:MAG: YaaL family protein [Bacilli bacterium]